MSLYFNEQTKEQLHSLSKNLPHAVLLTGEPGVGLLTAAKFLAADNIAAIIEPRDKDEVANHTTGTVTVKRIRELYAESSGKSITKRVFIIDDADKMSPGAQNAFLKLLEEPAAHTHFILTSHQPGALLATVRSRVEQTNIQPISVQQSKDILLQLKLSGAQAAQALFVAAGKPAELHRLASSDSYFSNTVNAMSAAKAFIAGSRAEAIGVAYKHASDRSEALQLLSASKSLLLHSAKNQASPEIVEKLAKLNAAYDAIAANGNVKLHMMAAMV